jgi:cell division protein FtsQ
VTLSPHAVAADMEFRRRRFSAPHRRRSPLVRLLRPFLAAAVTVALPSALAAWVLFSNHFVVQGIEIHGTTRVPREWTAGAVESLHGSHILALPLEAVESELAKHPWVWQVEVRKELPDQVVVKILEKSPVALLRRGEELHYLAADGTVIDRLDSRRGPTDLPLFSGHRADQGSLQEALAALEAFHLAMPEVAKGISEVELMGQGDLRLFTSHFPFPIVVRGEDIAGGLQSLREHLTEVLEAYPAVAAVDVRFPRQIVVKPAVEPRTREG